MALATALAVVGAIGAVGGAIQGKKASKADKKAAKARAQIARLENAKTRRTVVRNARILQAQNLARGATSGSSIQSSGIQGEQQSLGAQEKFNLDFLDKADALNTVASNAEIKAANLRGDAALFGGVSNAAFAGAGLFV